MPPDSPKHIEHVHLVASRPVWAIIGGLFGIIATGFCFWLTTVQADQSALETKVSGQEAAGAKTSERLGRVETKLEGVDKSTDEIKDTLKIINGKLDRLSERVR